jgi:hypothetical protein
MTSDHAETVSLTATHILAYLERHPLAADTARGISNWWLREQGLQVPESIVVEALETLVAQGQVERQVAAGGEVLFKMRVN